jgi:endonuclease/exonuclease/phosphatase family metal-dependent hydrolase
VIVGGDFNLTHKEGELLRQFATNAGLTDACTVLACPEPQRIDRVLYRGSPTLQLQARNWKADRSFVDPSGQPLSDHLPVIVELGWTKVGL